MNTLRVLLSWSMRGDQLSLMDENMEIKWVLVLLGAPGSGKETQARRLSRTLGLPQISTGDILRRAVEMGTELGKLAKRKMQAGDLVPDDVMCGIMSQRIAMEDCRRGFILDGFPRTPEQVKCLDVFLQSKPQMKVGVFNIRVNKDLLIRRMLGRRICIACGEIYNIYLKPPKKEGVCNKDGGKLICRPDDNEVTYGHRQLACAQTSRTVMEHYSSRDVLYEVDGNWEPGVVSTQIYATLGKVRQELESALD